MAGDHKCPVCNSTFTRPQHVARHMRSHTGDRPYKCTHCGDQFARSDLLSRHINKCHASEKPPTTTAPNTRRKGPTAAARATTSKQACDQCVQSSLPCDGCNPCAKCVQRKYRCTYVKFHRQTAPQGPGHPPPNALPPNHPHAHHARTGSLSSTVGAASGSMLSGRPDDFVLAPPPGTTSLPAMNMYGSGFGLPGLGATMEYPGYPGYAPASTSGITRASPTPSLTASTSTRDSLDDSPDLMSRYRAQTMNPAAVNLPGIGSLAGYASSTAAPATNHLGLAGPSYPGYQPPTSSNSGAAWQNQSFHSSSSASPDSAHAVAAKDAGYAGGHLRYPSGSAVQTHPSAHAHMSSGAMGNMYSYPPPPAPVPVAQPQSHHESFRDHTHGYRDHSFRDPARPYVRAGSEDSVGGPIHGEPVGEYGNGRPHTSHAESASEGYYAERLKQQQRHVSQHSAAGANPHSSSNNENNDHNHSDGAGAGQDERQNRRPVDGEGGFSSAFGLMSLDDPAVLAGLQSDGQPFFSNVHPHPLPSERGSHRSSISSTSGASSMMSDEASVDSGLHMNSSQSSLADEFPDKNSSSSDDRAQQDDSDKTSNSGNIPFPSLSTPREDLREFWKQFLKTPLSGPGSTGGTGITPFLGPSSAGLGGLITPTGSGDGLQLGADWYGSGVGGYSGGANNVSTSSGSSGSSGRPQLSPTRRHSRVASLPSLKTPTLSAGLNALSNEWFNTSPQGGAFDQSQGSSQSQSHSSQGGQSGFSGAFGGVPSSFNLTLNRDALRRNNLPDPTGSSDSQYAQRQQGQGQPVSTFAQFGGAPSNASSNSHPYPQYQQHSQQYAAPPPPQARTHTEDANEEDLKSYKQAVMARKAPTTLHLAPRRRGKTIHNGVLMGGTGSKVLVEGTDVDVARQQPPSMQAGQGPGGGFGSGMSSSTFTTSQGLPRGAANPTSSLAEAFGRSGGAHGHQGGGRDEGGISMQTDGDRRDHEHEHGRDSPTPGAARYPNNSAAGFFLPPPPPLSASSHMPSPPSSATTSRSPTHTSSSRSPIDTQTDYSSSSVVEGKSASLSPSYRPSFKRLASQTLGPEGGPKRALLGPAGWDEEEEEEEDEQHSQHAQRPSSSSGQTRVGDVEAR
ncbi:hypothetical protein K474DRAFT_478664 [Panus rudis PR-1116 ss-1]|nr:hypothetical protein K474DRAFT_478664 [Panus rudis PR-1116 ss-1]